MEELKSEYEYYKNLKQMKKELNHHKRLERYRQNYNKLDDKAKAEVIERNSIYRLLRKIKQIDTEYNEEEDDLYLSLEDNEEKKQYLTYFLQNIKE
jgi:hypothetical protein